jgi:hypothetical protein
MDVMSAIINKPSNIIEVFSACKYFKIKKLILYTPSHIKINELQPNKINLNKYVRSFNSKELNFDINLKKFDNKLSESFDRKFYFKLIKKILKNKKVKYIAFQSDNSLIRIYLFLKQNITTIGLTDGSVDVLTTLDHFIINKSRNFINFFKIPFYFITYNFFKVDYSFSFFDDKVFFSKKTVKNFNFKISTSLLNILSNKKIKILIMDEPTKTIPINEIIKKYNLINKNFCSIGRQGKFYLNKKINKKFSIFPELLLNNNLIAKVYSYPQSSVYLFAKKKKIKIYKLPSNIFNFPNCRKIFHKYILKKFLEIK